MLSWTLVRGAHSANGSVTVRAVHVSRFRVIFNNLLVFSQLCSLIWYSAVYIRFTFLRLFLFSFIYTFLITFVFSYFPWIRSPFICVSSLRAEVISSAFLPSWNSICRLLPPFFFCCFLILYYTSYITLVCNFYIIRLPLLLLVYY
jgi:hypothetical protein